MAELSEVDIVKKFSQHVKEGDLTKDIGLLYKVAVGKPKDKAQEVFELSGNGKVRVKRRNPLKSIPLLEASSKLDKIEAIGLFRDTAPGVESLLARGEERFLPDSLLSSITVRVGSEEATFYFLASEKQRVWQKKPIAPELLEAMQRIARISKHLIGKENEAGNE